MATWSTADRRAAADPTHPSVSVVRQCTLLSASIVVLLPNSQVDSLDTSTGGFGGLNL